LGFGKAGYPGNGIAAADMIYEHLLNANKRFGTESIDIVHFVFQCEPEAIQSNVIIAPLWKPELFSGCFDKNYCGKFFVTRRIMIWKNKEPVMDQPALHTLEHLGATFLRSHKVWAERVVYFGPMGCRTGFYAIFEGDLNSEAVLPLIKEMLVSYPD